MDEQLPDTLEAAVLAVVLQAENPVAQPKTLLDLILATFML